MKVRPFKVVGGAVSLMGGGVKTSGQIARVVAKIVSLLLLIPALLFWLATNFGTWSRPFRWLARKVWARTCDLITWADLWAWPALVVATSTLWLSPGLRDLAVRAAAGPHLVMGSACALIATFSSRSWRRAMRTNLEVHYERRYKRRWVKYCEKYGVYETTKSGRHQYPKVWVECAEIPEWREIFRGLLQFDGKSAKPPSVKFGVTPVGPRTMGAPMAAVNLEGLLTYFKFVQAKTPMRQGGDWVFTCVNRRPTQHLKIQEVAA